MQSPHATIISFGVAVTEYFLPSNFGMDLNTCVVVTVVRSESKLKLYLYNVLFLTAKHCSPSSYYLKSQARMLASPGAELFVGVKKVE